MVAHRRRARCSPVCSTRASCSSPSACARACSRGLSPAELAGLVSVFVYEHRSPDDPPAAVVPVGRVQGAVAPDRADQRRPRHPGAPGQPRRAPSTRSDVRRPRLRLGRGRGLRRGDRRGGSQWRRFRTHDEAARRPAPPDRTGRAVRPRCAGPHVGQRPTRSATWSPMPPRWRTTDGDRQGRAVGRGDRPAGRTWRSPAPTPSSPPSSLAAPGEYGRVRWRSLRAARTTAADRHRHVASRWICCGSPPTAVQHVAVAHVVARHSSWRGRSSARSTSAGSAGGTSSRRRIPTTGGSRLIEVAAAMPWRQRLAARRRLPAGTHLPAPVDQRLATSTPRGVDVRRSGSLRRRRRPTWNDHVAGRAIEPDAFS